MNKYKTYTKWIHNSYLMYNKMVSKNKNCNWTQKKSACFKQGIP